MNIPTTIKFEKIIDCLVFLIGLTCSFNALKFGGFSFYNYLLIILTLLLVYTAIRNKSFFYIRSDTSIWMLFGAELVFSLLININVLSDSQIKESVLFLIKLLLLIYPLFLLSSKEKLSKYSKVFFKGLRIALYVQLYWSFAQVLAYHLFDFSLNELVFTKLLHVSVEGVSWTMSTGIGIRPTGLSWEPANLAIVLAMGYALSTKKVDKLLFIFGMLLSTSSTGYLTLACVILYDIIHHKRKPRIRHHSRMTRKKLAITCCSILLVCLVLFIFNKQISRFLSVGLSYANLMFNRFSTNLSGGSDEISFNIHKSYYLNLPYIIENQNIFKTIFGNGTLAAGRVYNYFFAQTQYSTGVWNPESDFITLFIGNGIVGLAFYYGLIFKSYLHSDNQSRKLLLIIAFAGIFYLFFRGTWTFLTVLMLCFSQNKEETLTSTMN